jgi:H+/Cl- antiporter ClcA
MARYLAFVAAPVGAVVGVAIGIYDWVVNELLWKHISERSLVVAILAPALGMFITGCLLQAFRVRSSSMADEVVSAYHDPDVKMPVDTAVAKLAASVTTMGFGASIREGIDQMKAGNLIDADKALAELRAHR